MKDKNRLYLNLFQAVEELHTEGDGVQQRLADKLSTIIHTHLETRGMKIEDIPAEVEDNNGRN